MTLPCTLKRGRSLQLALAGALIATFALAGCGGDDEAPAADPAAVTAALTAAKANFDQATGVHLRMTTAANPTGDAVLGAEGDLTNQPAFKGDVKVNYLGFKAVSAQVISVGGKVYVDLPLPGGYSELDPATVGAPDPADFMDPSTGISGLLLKLTDVKQTDTKREGKKTVTTYSGTLSGDLVAPIIPSASKDTSYATVVGIADGQLTTLSITGDFFDGEGAATFDLVFDRYGEIAQISAP